MKKIIAILLVVIIGIAGVAIVFKSQYDKKQNASLRADSERMTQLIAKRNILEEEIAIKWNEYHENTNEGMCYIVLFFDNITPNLMSDVYPLVSKYGYSATAVMTNLQTPGDEGCISMEEYNALVSAGWDFAIGTGDLELSLDNGEKELAKYINDYKVKLEEKGIPMPGTFCFDAKEYEERYDSLLWENGFKIVRHFGEAGNKFSRSAVEGRIYHLGSGVLCTGPTTMKADIGEAIVYNYSYSATTRYVKRESQDENLDCTHSKYTQMLDYLVGTPVVNATALYNEKIKALSLSADYIEAFNTEMTEMEDRLEKIKTELKTIVE